MGKQQSKKSKRSNSRSKVTFAQMIRDVLIAGMNKGQFLPAAAAIICIIAAWRLPPADLSILVFGIGRKLLDWSLVGYLWGGLVTIAWSIHAKMQRRQIHDEMARLSEERNELQKKQLGEGVKSSKE